MKKIKTALFSTIYLQASQTFIYQEIKSLKNCAVDVFCREIQNLDRFPYERVILSAESDSPAGKLRGLLYEIFCYSARFNREFEKNHYDVVHAQFGPGGIYAMAFAMRFSLPLLVTFCGYDVPILQTKSRFLPKNWRYWLLSRTLFKRATIMLAVSRDLADRLISLGADPEKVIVFHRGIEIPELHERAQRSPSDPIRVVMAGRYVEKKGFQYGIEAVAMARRQGCNVILEIVGKGRLQPECEKLVRELGIEDAVTMTRELSQDDFFKRLEAADIVMVPSVTAKNGDVEGITNVLKEGAARGLVALISNHGGNPEAVEDGVTGFIVPERDSEKLAEKLVEIARHPERIGEMGAKGAEKMRNEFNLENTGQKLEAIYRMAVERYNNRR